jgi:transcriptional regulator with XRE-family HTH domain
MGRYDKQRANVVKDHRQRIGKALKQHRLAAHLSQMALAEKIGISYQQLQKYENGTDNISLYRLQQICEALTIPVSSIIEVLEEAEHGKIAEDISTYGLSKEEKTLLDLFRRITNKDIRRGLLLELKGIAGEIQKK